MTQTPVLSAREQMLDAVVGAHAWNHAGQHRISHKQALVGMGHELRSTHWKMRPHLVWQIYQQFARLMSSPQTNSAPV